MVTPAPSNTAAFSNFFGTLVRGFSAYARWLDSISWKRFFLLALLAMIVAGITSELPPFNIRWGEDKVTYRPRSVTSPKAPKAPVAPKAPKAPAPPAEPGSDTTLLDINGKQYTITIDQHGVRIGPATATAVASAPAKAPASAASSPPDGVHVDLPGVKVDLPSNATDREVRQAIEEAKDAIKEAIDDAKEAERDAQAAAEDAAQAMSGMREVRIPAFRPGDYMPQFAFLLIVISGITKIMAAGRFKAEAQAVVATEMAESEALKRQVIEARMAAMQAQVEPHFLFNTLASIDHLIEFDPKRASQMQRNLISLLRASMPSMRTATDSGLRPLDLELAVVRPYLEILKVRMEERLTTAIDVPEGLLSAEFPPMMVQTLVENSIKHGLEPKAEGGHLAVKAEIRHGKLCVTVSDTGLGFGSASPETAGTGVGLANIRERLQLLYGNKASMVVAENAPSGTLVTLTVPYQAQAREGEAA